MVGCKEAAEHMLSCGTFFSAAKLGADLNVTAIVASGFLYNIRSGKKYETIETALPNREVKLISISGRKVSASDLWKLALS